VNETRRGNEWVWVVVALVLVAWALIRVETNIHAKAAPPAACQLLGGTWNIWDGWRCG